MAAESAGGRGCLAEGREGAPSPKSVTGKSFVRNNVNEHSGSRRKQKKKKSDEEERQTNRNGTEKRMLMMTKRRIEKTKQGRNDEKGRIIVSGVPMAKTEVEKGLMMLRMMMVSPIDNGNEE
jgi:hypothetical protein